MGKDPSAPKHRKGTKAFDKSVAKAKEELIYARENSYLCQAITLLNAKYKQQEDTKECEKLQSLLFTKRPWWKR